jgi:hypothetical protein
MRDFGIESIDWIFSTDKLIAFGCFNPGPVRLQTNGLSALIVSALRSLRAAATGGGSSLAGC